MATHSPFLEQGNLIVLYHNIIVAGFKPAYDTSQKSMRVVCPVGYTYDPQHGGSPRIVVADLSHGHVKLMPQSGEKRFEDAALAFQRVIAG
jgi:hypothetical protein